jgi:uncharacterized protein
MRTSEFAIPGIDGSGLLRRPDGAAIRGGVVALHPAAPGTREQPLFDHLAQTVTPLGFAVLSYDRRASLDGSDVPFELQAADALAAIAALRTEIDAPVGLYGFSQGAWSAGIAASISSDVAFLALLGCCGVSPAVQMRYYTDELLRRNGYGDDDRAQLRALRLAAEGVLRGVGDREKAGAMLADAAGAPWFEHAWLPPELPPAEDRWDDMDFDPEPIYRKVTCPTLLMYGEDEECTPAGPSAEVWRRAADVAGNSDLTIVDVPGCGHFPAPQGSPMEREFISPEYTQILTAWFDLRR